MRRAAFAVISLAVLTACSMRVPNSGAGVGFDTFEDYQATLEAELIANGEGGNDAVSVEEEGTPAPASDLADEAMAAIGRSSDAPASESPADPTGQFTQVRGDDSIRTVENDAGISAENDFSAVSSERTIEQDAARVAANKEAYQTVETTALPARPSGAKTSLVAFALSTTNAVGQPLYSRLILGAESRAARNCAKYPSPDLAQEAFLAGGGPQRNVRGLDPDGDGFACSWDPHPFRLAAGRN